MAMSSRGEFPRTFPITGMSWRLSDAHSRPWAEVWVNRRGKSLYVGAARTEWTSDARLSASLATKSGAAQLVCDVFPGTGENWPTRLRMDLALGTWSRTNRTVWELPDVSGEPWATFRLEPGLIQVVDVHGRGRVQIRAVTSQAATVLGGELLGEGPQRIQVEVLDAAGLPAQGMPTCHP